MPIFEFRCLKCGTLFEKLIMQSDREEAFSCPHCHSHAFERVVSRSNYAMGAGRGGKTPRITSKSCGPSNQCMTLDLPGPTK